MILKTQPQRLPPLVTNSRIRLAGIAVLTAINFGFSSIQALVGVVQGSFQLYVNNFSVAFLPSICMWEGTRLLIIYYNRRYTVSTISAKRFGVEAVLVLLLNIIVYVVFLPLVIYIDESNPPVMFLVYGAFDRALYGLIIAALYELFFFMQALKIERLEKEELKKINLSIQLESLKNQVKPHFLFNSLNTLTALVEKDPEKAVRFIAELSKVYRYLLQSNEKETISLAQELEFTQAYFYLLHMRFGDGLSLRIDVPEFLHKMYIPPLTLQMLVENAVKHNQVSVRKPLHIEIFTDDQQWLVVQNNLQAKRHALSNGVGLSNIAAKFKLLNQSGLHIATDASFFTIKIPLIKPPLA